jgi:hypothetical protein
MKKSKFSIAVALAIVVASLSAFIPHSGRITAGWYGQITDAVPPYSTSFPISASDLNTVCPSNQTHLCAVKLKSDGTLDAQPNTARSTHNFQP